MIEKDGAAYAKKEGEKNSKKLRKGRERDKERERERKSLLLKI